MTPPTSSFENRFLSKIGKIDSRRIRDYVARLASQKAFFENIFARLDEGIIVTGDDLRILYCNPVARLFLQLPKRKRWMGADLADSCPRGELRDVLDSMKSRPRRIDHYECTTGQDSARHITLTTIAVPAPEEALPQIADPDVGDIHKGDAGEAADAGEETSSKPASMWVYVLQDVTERYRSIEEQTRAQRLASLAMLTSGVAHEIKNPLNSLNIHAQILLEIAGGEGNTGGEGGDELDRAKVRRAAEVIIEESERLTRIVDEFIQAARPQSAVLSRQSIADVLAEIERIFGPQCEQAGIELRTEVDPDLPQVDIDAHLILQALRNLVRNAIEAHDAEPQTPGDDEPRDRRILVRAALAAENMAIEVSDNGPGIAEENVDKIFEPYYTTKFNGTGLGLMVVYRIVTQHRGSIHVESRPGMGTRFVIALPLGERPVRLLEEPAPEAIKAEEDASNVG